MQFAKFRQSHGPKNGKTGQIKKASQDKNGILEKDMGLPTHQNSLHPILGLLCVCFFSSRQSGKVRAYQP